MSYNKDQKKKRSIFRNRYFISFLALVAVVALMIVLGIFTPLFDKDDALPPIDQPTTFQQPDPEQYEKPTDLPEAPGEEEPDEDKAVGASVEEGSSEEETARKAAESSLVEWGKQNSEEKPKNRVKRMQKIATKDSAIPDSAPLFIDSWHEGSEGDDHEDGDEGKTSSTVEIEGMSFDRSNGSNQITYNAILSVTVHEEFMDEKFNREPYDFKVTITMQKEGKDWKADLIIPAAY